MTTTFNAETFQAIIDGDSLLKDWIYCPYITSSESFDDAEELNEYLLDRVTECEVIYYTNAIKFLAEEDPSLMEALELANDCGYTTDKLNSELLATLLLQQRLTDALGKCDFSECFEEKEG